ncbi:MAG: class A beta-lactamase-related serine hydrolase [Candidatus Omnitrophica bacterium]|nr:class A beta-lactamase-related serine hydrolase [Candidatus Omnitrophota bacterium]
MIKKIIRLSLYVFFIILVAVFYHSYSARAVYVNLYKDIDTELSDICDKLPFQVSYLIQDLKYKDITAVRLPDRPMPAASLIKLPLLGSVFKAIDEGKISLSDSFLINRKDITGGSGVLKAKKLPVELKLEELLELMIAFSDNSATNKVINILGREYIADSFKYLGFNDSILARDMMDFSSRRKGIENYTTVNDVSKVLQLLYGHALVRNDLSDFAIEILKKQKVRDRIPKYLPNMPIAHKTGLERSVVHDAGIVFSPEGDYLICVFTHKFKTYKEAKEAIAQISKIVYELYKERL